MAVPVPNTTEKKATEAQPTDRRFARRNRLFDAASYSRVFKQAKRSRDNVFTVLYKANELDEARLGLAISKKHCKLATGRNRLKRLVRESFRMHREELAGLDVIVMNRPAAATTENSELTSRLEKHWQRCGDNSADEAGKN